VTDDDVGLTAAFKREQLFGKLSAGGPAGRFAVQPIPYERVQGDAAALRLQ
jgi:hypothetical protein